MGKPPYDDRFYRLLDATAEASAAKIVPIVLELWPARSVVDFGCGDGGWLAAFQSAGVDDVLGLDGPWIDMSLLKIPASQFRRVALDELVAFDRRFDLAISLEVAEHLAPDRADLFVTSLTSLAPVVLFSAAVPGQGGVHHVNEQWPSYWTARFGARGYQAIDIRPSIWNDEAVAWWYRQNLLLFASPAAISERQELMQAAMRSPSEPPALVHPELFAHPQKRLPQNRTLAQDDARSDQAQPTAAQGLAGR
jgi:SAM-dependent methyltransferase